MSLTKTRDRIIIGGLQLETTIGVPDEERNAPQVIAVDVEMTPHQALAGLNDEIERTIDYFEVTLELERIAASRERKLIETLAEDLAEGVLAFDGVSAVTITIRKFILPQTDYVSVVLSK